MNLDVITNLLTVVGLAAMMLSVGLNVTIEEVIVSIRRWRTTILGLVGNFVLVPAATIGLLWLFAPDPMVAVGFLIPAVCPGAPVGPPFAAIAKGNVPYAVGQMVLLSGSSAVLSPLLLGLFLGWLLPSSDLHVDFAAIVRTLLVAQLLPLGVGLAIHRQAQWAHRAAKPVALFANLLLLGAIGLMLARQHELLGAIRLGGWIGMLLLLVVTLAIGWLSGGSGVEVRKASALTTAARNAALALVIVSGNFAETAAVTAVVAYAFVSIFGSLGCALALGAMPTHVSGGSAAMALARKEEIHS